MINANGIDDTTCKVAKSGHDGIQAAQAHEAQYTQLSENNTDFDFAALTMKIAVAGKRSKGARPIAAALYQLR